MERRPVVSLNGCDLSIDEITAIGSGSMDVDLDPAALDLCRSSRAFLEEEVGADRIIYGVNTSFGPMCNKIIAGSELETLQINLIRSHAAGLGSPLEPAIARAALVVRLNSLVKGYSGVRVNLLTHLREMINGGIAPYMPECGSVGASGDLVHLAHAALAVIGEGKVFYQDSLCEAKQALAACGLKPLRLSFKEGIALMNGTAVMTAIAAFAVAASRELLGLACINGALAMEIFGGIDDAFDEDLHSVKPHPGQTRVAALIKSLFHGSRNVTARDDIPPHDGNGHENGPVFETPINVQDVYSIRCTPQILAPVYEAIESAAATVVVEANSCNDNPVIIPQKRKIIHGGNFHGMSIGFAMDSLATALAYLCNLSERRLNKLLDRNLNEGLPEQLAAGPAGLDMGFMGAQYLATSTTAENRQLANPVSTLSISCNGSNQDVVSMGTIAARKAWRSAGNARNVLALETMAQLQALSFRNAEGLGSGTKRIHDILRAHFTPYTPRRPFHDDLVAFRDELFEGGLLDELLG